MLSTYSSPYFIYLVLILTVLLIVGIVAVAELYSTIFPPCVTSVSDRLLVASYRTVLIAAIVYCAIVILHQLIGGGINAL